MMQSLHLSLLAALTALLAGCSHIAVPTADIAITNVHVVDVAATSQEDAISPLSTVLIKNGKIAEITPAEAAPRALEVVDGRNGYILPALWDMHMHLFSHPDLQEIEALLYAANGVLFVRDMGNNLRGPDITALKSAWAQPTSKAPTIAAHAGAIIQHQREVSPDDWPGLKVSPDYEVGIAYGEDASIAGAYNLVQRRADFLKPYNGLSEADLSSLIAFAKQRGVAVSGHIAYGIPVANAAQLGMRTLEHARMLPFDCSDRGPELRKTAIAAQTNPRAYRNVTQLRNDPVFLRSVVEGYDERLCRNPLEAMRRSGMHYVPTHVTREMDARAGETDYEASLPLDYLPSWARADWEEDFGYYGTLPPSQKAAFKSFLNHGIKLTRMAYEAGVPLMIGTDAGDTAIFPGFSVHREMDFWKQAGIPPLAILKAATLTPATFMGLEDTEGTLEVGKSATAIIVDANPLLDLRALRQPMAVIKSGHVWRKDALGSMREGALAIAKHSQAPAVTAGLHRCRVHRVRVSYGIFPESHPRP